LSEKLKSIEGDMMWCCEIQVIIIIIIIIKINNNNNNNN
jgi:hypothetical protein